MMLHILFVFISHLESPSRGDVTQMPAYRKYATVINSTIVACDFCCCRWRRNYIIVLPIASSVCYVNLERILTGYPGHRCYDVQALQGLWRIRKAIKSATDPSDLPYNCAIIP